MSFIAQITADISNFDKNIKKAVDTTNDSTGKMDSKFANLGKSIAKVGVGVAAFGAAAVAAGVGLVKLATSAGDATARINNFSEATDLSTDVIQELTYVAQASNSSFEGLTNSMNAFQRSLKTADEEGSKTNETLAKLGVSTTDASGEMRSMDDVLLDTFKSLGDMEKGLKRNAIGTELFRGAWRDVALIVSSGADGIEDLRKEANELGLVLDKDTLKSADNFATAMGLVSFQVDKLKTKIGASLVPILENTILPLLQDEVIPAISKVVESIAKGVENMIKAWGDLKAYFTTGAGADTFDAIVRDAIAFKQNITTVFTEIARTLNSIWASMGNDLGDETETFLQTVNRAFQNTLNLWRNLWIDFKKARASETLIEEFTNIGTMFSNFGKGLVADVVEPVDKVEKAVEDLTDSQIAAMVGLNEFSSEIEETKDNIDSTTDSITGLTEALDIFQSGKISEAIRVTSNEIKVLGDYLKDLRAGKIEIANVHDEIVKVEERISVLNTALNTLTGDRELNIKVNTDSALDLFKDTDFGSDAGLVIPILPAIDTSLLKDGIGDLRAGLTEVAIDVSGMLTDLISGAFASIGEALVSGDNIMASLGASLLGTLGGILVQLGEMAIAVGIGLEAIKKALSTLNPIVAIAAGGALIALGAMFSAGSRKLSQSIGSGGGGYSNAPSMQSTRVASPMPTGEFRDSYSSGKVVFEIGGDKLIGVLDRQETRRNRSL